MANWQVHQNAGNSMKNIIIYINSRIIETFANIIKFMCYVFHFLFPNKRFTLPKHAKPIIRRSTPLNIPITIAIAISVIRGFLLTNIFNTLIKQKVNGLKPKKP